MSSAADRPDRCSGRADAHVFVVHSHIAHWVARAVMAHERLDPGRVTVLAGRGMDAAAAELRPIPLAIEAVRESPGTLREVWRARRWLGALDRRLAAATRRRSFHLYLPQTVERALQALRSHPRCAGFSFLEEGLFSYCTSVEMDQIVPPPRIRRGDRLAFGGRVGAAHFFEPGHARAYGIHPAVFPGLAGRVVLSDAVPPPAAATHPRIRNVIAFDALSATRQVQVESVCSALERLLDRLAAEGETHLHYKLHPAQAGHREVAALESALQRRSPTLAAERLPDALSLEGLAWARRDVRFFVNLSSVGFYAALAGCPAFSWARWVVDAEPGFARVVARVPRVFSEHVRFLDAAA